MLIIPKKNAQNQKNVICVSIVDLFEAILSIYRTSLFERDSSDDNGSDLFI